MTATATLIPLTDEDIHRCFDGQTSQEQYMVALYKLVFPDWDDIVSIADGWPACNGHTWKKIARIAMEFDRVHHPDCLQGGAWMNSGFSTDDTLPDGVVDAGRCRVVRRDAWTS